MLAALKRFFTEMSEGAPRGGVDGDERRLAAIALLTHVAAVDGVAATAESARLVDLVTARVGVDPDKARALLAAARRRDRESIDLHAFTSLLNRKLNEAGRQEIVDMMWEIAFADGVLHEFEESIILRVADLLGVPGLRRSAPQARPTGAEENA